MPTELVPLSRVHCIDRGTGNTIRTFFCSFILLFSVSILSSLSVLFSGEFEGALHVRYTCFFPRFLRTNPTAAPETPACLKQHDKVSGEELGNELELHTEHTHTSPREERKKERKRKLDFPSAENESRDEEGGLRCHHSGNVFEGHRHVLEGRRGFYHGGLRF